MLSLRKILLFELSLPRKEIVCPIKDALPVIYCRWYRQKWGQKMSYFFIITQLFVQFTSTSTNHGAQSHHPLVEVPIKISEALYGGAPKELIAPNKFQTWDLRRELTLKSLSMIAQVFHFLTSMLALHRYPQYSSFVCVLSFSLSHEKRDSQEAKSGENCHRALFMIKRLENLQSWLSGIVHRSCFVCT